jgi:hypothetical protein
MRAASGAQPDRDRVAVIPRQHRRLVALPMAVRTALVLLVAGIAALVAVSAGRSGRTLA